MSSRPSTSASASIRLILFGFDPIQVIGAAVRQNENGQSVTDGGRGYHCKVRLDIVASSDSFAPEGAVEGRNCFFNGEHRGAILMPNQTGALRVSD